MKTIILSLFIMSLGIFGIHYTEISKSFNGAKEERERIVPEYNLDQVTITWVRFYSLASVINACRDDMNLKPTIPGGSIVACATFNPTKKTCTIFVRMPKYVKSDMYIEHLGHEVLHCFTGKFHK